MRRKAKGYDASDPQRSALYRWEIAHENWNVCAIDQEQCEYVAEKALKFFDCEPVDVQCGSSARYSWNIPAWRMIAMQSPSRAGRGGMNVATVLHECAHQIVWDLHGEGVRDHGPTFLGIYRELLLAARVLTVREFDVSARHYGLRWRSP